MAFMNVRGDWAIVQSNGPVVEVHVDQNLSPHTGALFLTGNASHNNGSVRSRSFRGTLSEGAAGAQIVLVIQWTNGTIGEYHGTFSPSLPGDATLPAVSSTLSGITFDQTNPASQATWRASKTFTQ